MSKTHIEPILVRGAAEADEPASEADELVLQLASLLDPDDRHKVVPRGLRVRLLSYILL